MTAPKTVRVDGCNKVGWLSRDDARAHHRQRFPTERLRVFTCEHCSQVLGQPVFHLGHLTRRAG